MLKHLGKVFELPLKKIRRDKNQPRKYFDRIKMENLTMSIKKIGQITPIQVKVIKGGWQIVTGERRFRACTKLRQKTIKAYIVEGNEDDFDDAQIVENLLHENLSTLETARIYLKRKEKGLTEQEIAERYGTSQSTVHQYISLNKLDPKVQRLMEEGTNIPEKNRIKFSTALTLVSFPLDVQVKLATQISENGMTLADARNLIVQTLQKRGVVPNVVRKKNRGKEYSFLFGFISPVLQRLEILIGSKVSYITDTLSIVDPQKRNGLLKMIGKCKKHFGQVEKMVEKILREVAKKK